MAVEEEVILWYNWHNMSHLKGVMDKGDLVVVTTAITGGPCILSDLLAHTVRCGHISAAGFILRHLHAHMPTLLLLFNVIE